MARWTWRVTLRAVFVSLGSLAIGCGPGANPVPEIPRQGITETQVSSVGETEAVDANPRENATLAPVETQRMREALAAFNHGGALLEQYKYSSAAERFEAALEVCPDWTAARFNLGLALLNLQGQSGARDNLTAAKDCFEAILTSDPDHRHARFCLGMYYQYQGDLQGAADCFLKVHQSDPEDAYAAYKCAESLRSIDQHERAIEILERAVDDNPGFVSGVYLLANLYMRDRQRDRAKPLFDRFKALNAAELTGGSHVVQSVYGTAGKYYTALGADEAPLLRDIRDTDPVRFSPDTKSFDAQPVATKSDDRELGPGLAVADIDGDGDLDACLAGCGDAGETLLLRNDGSGHFSVDSRLGSGGIAPCFGDVDNDGDVDLWLGGDAEDILLLNDGRGGYSPPESDLPPQPADSTVCARMFDIDSDGDLDLFACGPASGPPPGDDAAVPASRVWLNHRDGDWTETAAEFGLDLPGQTLHSVAYDDFDGDFDLDLLLMGATGELVLWINDRLGAFRLQAASETGLDVSSAIHAITGDPDKDGDRDVLVFCRDRCRLFRNQGSGQFQEDPEFAAEFGTLGGTAGSFEDFDNDGDLDLLIADAQRQPGARGPTLLINRWPTPGFVDAVQVDAGDLLKALEFAGDASCAVADFTGDGRCDILLAAWDQPLTLIENATPGGHWIELDLVGTRPKDNKARSNSSAIGARVEIKTGSSSQQYFVGGGSGMTAMKPLRIHAGLGQHAKVDWLRVIWPDAVLQAEMEVPGDRVMRLEELPRKASSCPYLFAWDGTRFAFVADFGGVGGLGYLVSEGVYAAPDPTEYLPLPDLQPRGEHYVLQSLTPLEEITYFDEAKLVSVDHPEGTLVFPHEMMAISVPPPDFELFCFRELVWPEQATDHDGQDVTDRLSQIDRRYAGATDLDARFTGLAEPHAVVLDFGDRLEQSSPEARWVLLAHGWVEYGYSSTNFAGGQAGQRAEAPTIEVERDGRWVVLLPEVGYPAGLNHMMTIDLAGRLQPGDRRLRISSNMELYWDRIVLGQHDPSCPLNIVEVPVSSADLHFRGYPREFSPDGRHPNSYDYDNLDPSVGWKLMTGDYTRYGEVAPLLAQADDRFVIMGHGEELTLMFPVAAFPEIPPDSHRTFLLKTDSYCKDMDLYTAHPTTVEPLPFHAMSGYPYGPDEKYPEDDAHREYRRTYNTRRIGGRP